MNWQAFSIGIALGVLIATISTTLWLIFLSDEPKLALLTSALGVILFAIAVWLAL